MKDKMYMQGKILHSLIHVHMKWHLNKLRAYSQKIKHS